MNLTTDQKRIRAVKNRLCRADDEIMRKDILSARNTIEDCIQSLEKMLPPISIRNIKQMKKEKQFNIKVLKQLEAIKVPKGWEVAKLVVEFIKRNQEVPIESCAVTYDAKNNCFYAKTPRGYVYPEEIQSTLECIEIMKKANKIIKNEIHNNK